MRLRAWVSVLLLAALAIPAAAKVARMPLGWFLAESELIVIGREIAVTEAGEWKVATVVVEEEIMGSAGATITFLASPVWDCDTSRANVGDRAVYFLTRKAHRWFAGNSPPPTHHEGEVVYRLVHSGRGRLPITTDAGIEHVTIWTSDIELPMEVPTMRIPDSDRDWVKWVELDALRKALGE